MCRSGTRLPCSSGKVFLCLAVAAQWWHRQLKGWWQEKGVPISVWSIKCFKLLFSLVSVLEKMMDNMVISELQGLFSCVSKNVKFQVQIFLKVSLSRIHSSFSCCTFSLQSKCQNICHFCMILVDWVYKYFLGLQEGKKRHTGPCWKNSFCCCFVLLFSCDTWFHCLGSCSL